MTEKEGKSVIYAIIKEWVDHAFKTGFNLGSKPSLDKNKALLHYWEQYHTYIKESLSIHDPSVRKSIE